jgi:acyl-CoA synthetase (AMP-forming)/AMP-acid ligase II
VWIDETASLVDVLLRRAVLHPALPACTFLTDGEHESAHLTYGELDRRARALAAVLRALAAPGSRALLVYPPQIDFVVAFWACLYARIIAVPCSPPEPFRRDWGLPRLQAIAADARPELILTVSSLRNSLAPLLETAPEWSAARLHLTDDAAGADGDLRGDGGGWQPELPGADDVAFLQYTSGSTSSPRGVVLTHGNLIHNERMIRDAFGHRPALVVVGWLPLYHDMGLLGNVLQPLFMGGHSVLMSPIAFLRRPIRWLRAISRYRATTSGAPNFGYELCLRIAPEALQELDLSGWQVAYCGAEPVRAGTLERFAEKLAMCGFRRQALYPCYGLAEASLLVAGGAHGAPPVVRAFDRRALDHHSVAPAGAPDHAVPLVSCGWAHGEEEIAIVNPERGVRSEPQQVGEIWVRGPNVAAGYWNRPEESAATFGGRLAGDDGGPFLRTGDLGFMRDGQLYVTGRLKDIIIIAGRNHYPQDIERAVEECHDGLRAGGAAAFPIDVDEREQLAVVAEIEAGGAACDLGAMATAARRAVLGLHGVAVHTLVLVRRGAVPKTSSGKLQRRACRLALLTGTLEPLFVWEGDGIGDGGGLAAGVSRNLEPSPARFAPLIREEKS